MDRAVRLRKSGKLFPQQKLKQLLASISLSDNQLLCLRFSAKDECGGGWGGGRLGQDLAVFLKLFLVLGKEILREGEEGGRWPPARWQCIPAGKHKSAILATPHWLFDHDKPGQRMTDPVACDGQSSCWLRFRIRTWAALRNPGSADPCIAKNNPCSVIN